VCRSSWPWGCGGVCARVRLSTRVGGGGGGAAPAQPHRHRTWWDSGVSAPWPMMYTCEWPPLFWPRSTACGEPNFTCPHREQRVKTRVKGSTHTRMAHHPGLGKHAARAREAAACKLGGLTLLLLKEVSLKMLSEWEDMLRRGATQSVP
jgi:hypothetical protein